PADSTIVVPVDEPVFPPEGTEPVIPPPSTDITIVARIIVRPQTSISLPPEAEVERLSEAHDYFITITTVSLSPTLCNKSAVARVTAPLWHIYHEPPGHHPLLPSSVCPTHDPDTQDASNQGSH
ncbi:hypothetical protein Tco_0389285, partial [Tanacetum coccineum]